VHVIGTAGHVDHGKSTLVERLTGMDPDRFAEEKRRGLTIDLGFAWLRLPSGEEIGLIDVPGHERFIKNMLAGAGGISVCLFVVAANDGWMPQSSEHLAILHVLGISAGVVALTKSDTVDEETLELATLEIREHLAATPLHGAPIVACSAVTGTGLGELLTELDKVIASAPSVTVTGAARLWVDRAFSISGAGTVVTGTLVGGPLEAGQDVEVSPAGRRARIRAIQSHKREVARIGSGNRVALNLAGLERSGARRGDAIVEPGRWRPTTRVDALITVLPREIVGFDHILEEKGAHLLYVGSAETPVRLKLLEGTRVRGGEKAFAQLYLRDPLPITRGDRFVLRDAGRVVTFGGGIILDPLAPPARRGDDARLSLLQSLTHAGPHEALTALVEAEGRVSIDDALLRSGAVDVPTIVARLGSSLWSPLRIVELAESARRALSRHHDQNPLQRGMARESLRAHTRLSADEFDSLLTHLPDVVEEGPVVRMATHRVALTPDQIKERDRLREEIEARGFSPPLASELRADPSLVRALVESGDLIPIRDFFLTPSVAAEARRQVRAYIEREGPATVAALKSALGTSRRYAVPLCEWLDATGATRRQGDVRVVGPTP
jgi:selenocysteine-specific elongation factor